jgi:NRAMP (natural resistance-associated macrophage protein)-like metal ion transporter
MATCFFINFFTVKPDLLPLLRGTFVPTIPKGCMAQTIALFGCIIMPHNLYLHSALVLSRKIDTNNIGLVKESNFYNAIESAISLFISFLINYSIIGTFAYWHINEPG